MRIGNIISYMAALLGDKKKVESPEKYALQWERKDNKDNDRNLSDFDKRNKLEEAKEKTGIK